jgi:hypothetical protein
VIDAAAARVNAGAIRALDTAMTAPGAKRTGDCKLIEPLLID